jgi:hypothetical protein
MQAHHFTTGTKVYDTVGYMVGRLHAYNPQGGYLAVRTGGLFHRKDLYIPLDAVDHSGDTGSVLHLRRNGAMRDVSLLLSKDELKAERYNAPPTGGTTAPGGDGQSVPTTTRAQDHA